MAKNKNSENVIRWQKENPEAYKLKMRTWRMKKIYGITVEIYNQMLADQGGKCKICEALPTEKRMLAVDHCHTTGKVRALLCHTCNNLLGVFESRKAAFEAYLKEYG